MTETALGFPVIVRSIPPKGAGLFATEDIVGGSQVLAERPLFAVPPLKYEAESSNLLISERVEKTSEEDQRAFLALQNSFEDSLTPYCGIVKTNAIPLGPQPGAKEGGIFAVACRINHSCLPNCQKTWDAEKGEIQFHAIRNIAEGEEITFKYFDIASLGRENLRKGYNFDCACTVCTASK